VERKLSIFKLAAAGNRIGAKVRIYNVGNVSQFINIINNYSIIWWSLALYLYSIDFLRGSCYQGVIVLWFTGSLL
jgi:hypothetical protein